MKLHLLPSQVKCPFCGVGGLAFVRPRGAIGDLYRCTGEPPCKGVSLHHRRGRGACGISADGPFGNLVAWIECPVHVVLEPDEVTVATLTTNQVAKRLRFPVNKVIRLLNAGQLPGSKVGHRWRVSLDGLTQYLQSAHPSASPE
jgi:excisionase family DNA binding protein